MSQNQHRMTTTTMAGLKPGLPPLKNDATSLKESVPSLEPKLSDDMKEGLMRITSTSSTSEGKTRLTAHDKRCLKVQTELENNLVSASLALASFPATQKDGIVLAMRTTSISDSTMAVARADERFLGILERTLAYTIWGALVGELATLVVLIGANHGYNPLKFMGIKMPEKPKEQQEPEFSEEQRAMIFMNLMARQERMKMDYAGANS